MSSSTTHSSALEPADALATPIKPVVVSPSYKLALLLVALATIALPVVYVGLVGLLGFGLYYHAVANHAMLAAGLVGFSTYVLILAAGAAVIVFMLEPLFAGKTRPPQSLALDPAAEPEIYAFIRNLSQRVGAPVPRQIRVDYQPGATARFRRGVISAFLARDLVLTIGLPLCGALTLRQLTGTLARELALFTRSGGTRFCVVIQSVGAWLGRLVFGRTRLGDLLETVAHKRGVFLGLLALGGRFFYWLTRKVLWGFMVVGNVLASSALRKREHDADRYVGRIVGSETFVEIVRLMPVISVAHQRALDLSYSFWAEHRLADDFPALVVAQIAAMPAAVRDEIDRMIEDEQSEPFDDRPTTPQRIAAAEKHREAGVFEHDGTVAVLFADYPGLCRQLSLVLYRELVEGDVSPQQLRSVASLMRKRAAEEADFDALRRYFQDSISVLRPLDLPGTIPDNEEQTVRNADAPRQLREGREQVLDVAARRALFRRFDEADERLTVLRQCRVLLDAGFSIEAEPLGIEQPTLEALDQAMAATRREMEWTGGNLSGFEFLSTRRLMHALALAAVVEGPEVVAHITRLWPTLVSVGALLPLGRELRDQVHSLEALVMQIESRRVSEELHAGLVIETSRVVDKLRSLRDAAPRLLHPFDAEDEGHSDDRDPLPPITIDHYLVPELPERSLDHIASAFEQGGAAVDRLYRLYLRLLGRLASIAERVEQSFGLPPLPMPAEESEPEP